MKGESSEAGTRSDTWMNIARRSTFSISLLLRRKRIITHISLSRYFQFFISFNLSFYFSSEPSHHSSRTDASPRTVEFPISNFLFLMCAGVHFSPVMSEASGVQGAAPWPCSADLTGIGKWERGGRGKEGLVFVWSSVSRPVIIFAPSFLCFCVFVKRRQLHGQNISMNKVKKLKNYNRQVWGAGEVPWLFLRKNASCFTVKETTWESKKSEDM